MNSARLEKISQPFSDIDLLDTVDSDTSRSQFQGAAFCELVQPGFSHTVSEQHKGNLKRNLIIDHSRSYFFLFLSIFIGKTTEIIHQISYRMIHIFLIRMVKFHLNFVTDTEFRMYQTVKISFPSGMSQVSCIIVYFIPFEMAKYKECTVCEVFEGQSYRYLSCNTGHIHDATCREQKQVL